MGGDINASVYAREDKKEGVTAEVILRFGEKRDEKELTPEAYVGDACVDSGQVLIADPCYVLSG